MKVKRLTIMVFAVELDVSGLLAEDCSAEEGYQMASKTVGDLRQLRAKLIERRRQEAYWVGSEHHGEGLGKLVQVHQAIEALDAVIAEGKDAPPPTEPQMTILR
jgi:hypothetical protein